ncbi:hypothetical protein FOZ62_016942, partial [Perkinsus olseni]
SDELRPADEEAATPLANVCDPTDTAVNTHAHSLEGDPVFPPPATIDGGPRLAVHRLIDDILSSILGTAREDRHGLDKHPLAVEEGVDTPEQLLQWAEKSPKCEVATLAVPGKPYDLVQVTP